PTCSSAGDRWSRKKISQSSSVQKRASRDRSRDALFLARLLCQQCRQRSERANLRCGLLASDLAGQQIIEDALDARLCGWCSRCRRLDRSWLACEQMLSARGPEVDAGHKSSHDSGGQAAMSYLRPVCER